MDTLPLELKQKIAEYVADDFDFYYKTMLREHSLPDDFELFVRVFFMNEHDTVLLDFLSDDAVEQIIERAHCFLVKEYRRTEYTRVMQGIS